MRFFALLSLITVFLFCGCQRQREQIVTERHDNGNPRRVEIRDARTGDLLEIRTFHFNQIRDSVIPIRDGLSEGEFRVWSNSGTLMTTGFLKSGVLHGPLRTWYRERFLESEVRMVGGRPHGTLRRYFGDGSLQAEEFYDHGDTTGLWKKYAKDGSVLEIWSCHRREAHGIHRLLNTQGQILWEKHCLYGVPHGDEITYDASGNPRYHIRWEQGLRHGPQVLYSGRDDSLVFQFSRGTGTVRTPLAETSWVNGRLHGWVRRLVPDSNTLHRELWENGNLLHSWLYRLDSAGADSALIMSGSWQNGKRHGIWRIWYSHGTIKDSLQYRDGELWGRQYHYDSAGHLYMVRRHQGRRGQVIVEKLDPRPFNDAPQSSPQTTAH